MYYQLDVDFTLDLKWYPAGEVTTQQTESQVFCISLSRLSFTTHVSL